MNVHEDNERKNERERKKGSNAWWCTPLHFRWISFHSLYHSENVVIASAQMLITSISFSLPFFTHKPCDLIRLPIHSVLFIIHDSWFSLFRQSAVRDLLNWSWNQIYFPSTALMNYISSTKIRSSFRNTRLCEQRWNVNKTWKNTSTEIRWRW